jgi:hypothetical protein
LAGFPPSVLQVLGILWWHGRLSLALCCSGISRTHRFQTYDADDVVVCSGLCGGGIWSLALSWWGGRCYSVHILDGCSSTWSTWLLSRFEATICCI